MKKKELVSYVTEQLKANEKRKPITIPKQVFHISDNEGNGKDFVVKSSSKTAAYTTKDVEAVIDATIEVIVEAMKRGEEVSVTGFGVLAPHKRAERQTIHPNTGQRVVVKERYVPKFTYGKTLRRAALIYNMSLSENQLPFSYWEPVDEESGDA